MDNTSWITITKASDIRPRTTCFEKADGLQMRDVSLLSIGSFFVSHASGKAAYKAELVYGVGR